MSNTYPRRFAISTPEGDGEAIKRKQGDAWYINLPEGGLYFYGTNMEAQAKIREWLDEVRTGRVSFGRVEAVELAEKEKA